MKNNHKIKSAITLLMMMSSYNRNATIHKNHSNAPPLDYGGDDDGDDDDDDDDDDDRNNNNTMLLQQ